MLDVDPRHGGDVALEALERRHGRLPDTAEVLTGGGGRHIYFAPAPGLRCTSGVIGAGLDTRADGGYVLLPPSGHVSGGMYVEDLLHPLFDTALAPLPTWIIAGAQSGVAQNGDGPPEPTDWAAMLTGASEGARHATTLRIAGHFLAKGLTPGEVEAILLPWAARCSPPYEASDVRRVVHDLAAKDRQAAPPTPESAPSRPLRVIGTGDFLAEPDTEAVALVDGVLSDDGGGWLGGEEKLGKSWWAIEEAVCLAFGLPVCGRFAVPERRRVVLLEEEDSPRRVRRRLRASCAARGSTPTTRPCGRSSTLGSGSACGPASASTTRRWCRSSAT